MSVFQFHVLDFNPHSREGSDIIPTATSEKGVISIHTPAKGVTIPFPCYVKNTVYFNPHSREGSDEVAAYVFKDTTQISIHTPAKGVTFRAKFQEDNLTDFNPHSREGSDTDGTTTLHECTISIHTPAKGVTFCGVIINVSEYYFNPHSHEGSDVLRQRRRCWKIRFQSTLPRRE